MTNIVKPIVNTEEQALTGLDERTKIIFNAKTGEQTEVLLDETDKEYFRKKASKLEEENNAFYDKLIAEENAKVSGNQKLLDLGLTQAEATALTGYTPPVEE